MNKETDVVRAHPEGEVQIAANQAAKTVTSLDTFAGKIHVKWSPEAMVSSLEDEGDGGGGQRRVDEKASEGQLRAAAARAVDIGCGYHREAVVWPPARCQGGL